MATLPPQFALAQRESAQILTKFVQNQTPVKTGRLRRTMKVVPIVKRNEDLAFSIDTPAYRKYGRYVDLGTGRYRATKRGKYNARPGKGKGGIIPRFFTTINILTINRVKKKMAKAFADYVRFELKRAKLKVK